VEDLGSRNRTLVNGTPIEHPRALAFGDRLQLGPRVVLLFLNHGAERELLRRQRLEGLGRISAGVAHDVNNMLAVMLSSLDSIEENVFGGKSDDAALRECLDDARTAVAQAAGLTPRLLAFGREGREETVDVTALCSEIAQLARRTFERRIAVEEDIASGLMLRGDRVGLHQVLMNLCLNARDAMSGSGRMRVHASAEHAGIVLSVSDTGAGMDGGACTRIFEPFFTTKGALGAGLGLATVREVVTAHGGTIEVESAPGRGTTFRVRLPRRVHGRQPVVTIAHDKRPVTPAARRAGSILVVDDELTVRRAFARVLRSAGHSVTLAADGAAAIELFERATYRPDLVLLDLDMPGLRGDEVQRRLRLLDPSVCVVFVSGHRCPDIEEKVLQDGALAFLGKPLGNSALVTAVEQALDSSLRAADPS
jgi:CheY-like chemotaxis protein/two-component sensor histidine kinase